MSIQIIMLFVLLGVGPGALMAALALSIILSYRGDGVVNIAAGAAATVGAYVFYDLERGRLLILPLPWLPAEVDLGGRVATPLAIVIALVYCAALGLTIEYLVYRPLRRFPAVAKLVASIGLLLVLQAAMVMRFGGNGQSAPSVLTTRTFDFAGNAVPLNRLLLAGIVALVASALYAAYRFTAFGIATRAAQEDQDEALLSGLSPNLLASINNVAAFVLAGAFGILVAPLTSLDPNTLVLAVVPALAAALLAGFRSFGVAAAFGILLGVIGALVQLCQTQSWFPRTHSGVPIPGVTELIYFVLIVLILVTRGKDLPARGTIADARLPRTPTELSTRRARLAASGWLVVTLVAVTYLPADWRQAAINTLIGVVAALSLVILTGYVAQISLAQMVIAGTAGFVLSRLATHTGLGFPVAPILAVAGATVVGVLAGSAALRIRGVNLAIVTLAAASALTAFYFNNPDWGAPINGALVASPHLFGFNIGPTASLPFGGSGQPSPMMGYLALAALVPVALLVVHLRGTTLGHYMLAVRGNERATASAGISPASVKLTSFAMSSALVSLAGVLISYNLGSVDPGRFGIIVVLGLYAYSYVGGITCVLGAVIAGVGISNGLSTQLITTLGLPVAIQAYIGGLLLILTIVTNPGGLALSRPSRVAEALLARFRKPSLSPELGKRTQG
jgi:branched-chain amino acid transport system permease protein